MAMISMATESQLLVHLVEIELKTVFSRQRRFYATRGPQCQCTLLREHVSIDDDCPYMVQSHQERGLTCARIHQEVDRQSTLKGVLRVKQLLHETDLPRIAMTISFLSESSAKNPWYQSEDLETAMMVQDQ
jgi:hypothetical protein